MRPWPREHEHDRLGHILRGHHPGQRGHVRCPAATHREIGRDAARTHVRAADAALAQLVVEGCGQPDLGELGGAVDRLVGQAAPSRLAGDHDQVGGIAPEEVGEGRPDRVDRALHVDLDHLLELVGGQVQDRPVCTDARVDDEDVDPPEARHGRRDHRLERGRIANVAGPPEGAGDPEVVAAARGEGHVDPGRIEAAGDRRADAPARPGDEGDAPVQVGHGRSSCVGRHPVGSVAATHLRALGSHPGRRPLDTAAWLVESRTDQFRREVHKPQCCSVGTSSGTAARPSAARTSAPSSGSSTRADRSRGPTS